MPRQLLSSGLPPLMPTASTTWTRSSPAMRRMKRPILPRNCVIRNRRRTSSLMKSDSFYIYIRPKNYLAMCIKKGPGNRSPGFIDLRAKISVSSNVRLLIHCCHHENRNLRTGQLEETGRDEPSPGTAGVRTDADRLEPGEGVHRQSERRG